MLYTKKMKKKSQLYNGPRSEVTDPKAKPRPERGKFGFTLRDSSVGYWAEKNDETYHFYRGIGGWYAKSITKPPYTRQGPFNNRKEAYSGCL